MSKSRLSFCRRKKCFISDKPSYAARKWGFDIAIISITGNRYYWYKVCKIAGVGSYNTLEIQGSAITFEGCKKEIKDFVGNRPKEDFSR